MPPDGAPRNWWGDLAGTEPGSVRKIATVSATVAIDKRHYLEHGLSLRAAATLAALLDRTGSDLSCLASAIASETPECQSTAHPHFINRSTE